MAWLSHNEMWEAFGTRALFWAGTGSDFGEVKTTIGRIGAGDVHDWHITFSILVTTADGDPTTTGAPKVIDAVASKKKQLMHFTDAEGSGGHCEGTARMLYHQRTFDWLDEALA